MLGGLTITLAVLASQALSAKDSAQIAGFKASLASVSPIELPARAASLITAVSDKEKESTTISVVRAAVGLNPSAAPAIVGSVAHEVPTMAPLAAVTAASLQRKQIGRIAHSAAAGAPAQAGKIVAALIKEFPSYYAVVAVAASKGAPSAGKEILEVVASNVPALQASIQKAIAGFDSTAGIMPVEAILNQGAQQAKLTGGAASLAGGIQGPPTIGAPFTPLPVTPVEINSGNTSPEQPGGRYESP
ncbi:MAG: hypothetical protein JWR69_541 [Pedosphaera sp.]|nr:hypothetical protein [Pedosphaera sp.]